MIKTSLLKILEIFKHLWKSQLIFGIISNLSKFSENVQKHSSGLRQHFGQLLENQYIVLGNL